jgi:hypothetical protein
VAVTLVQGFNVILEFNEGDFGWQENFYVSNVNDYTTLLPDIVNLAALRVGVLSQAAALYGISIRPFLINGLGPQFVQTVVNPDGTLSPVAAAGTVLDSGAGPEPVWDGVNLDLWDTSRQYRRSYIQRGLPSQFLEWSLGGGGGLSVPGKRAMVNWLQQLQNTLPAKNGGMATAKVSMKTRLHDPMTSTNPNVSPFPGPNTGLQPITGAAANPTLCGTDISTGLAAVPPWNAGDTVHIHNIGGCYGSGLNGDHPVIQVKQAVAPAVGWITTIAASPCCCVPGTIPIGNKGTIYKVIYTLTPTAVVDAGNVTRRSTGAPKGGSRGRARACRR